MNCNKVIYVIEKGQFKETMFDKPYFPNDNQNSQKF